MNIMKNINLKIMMDLLKKIPLFGDNFKRDIRFGRFLLLYQGITIGIFGFMETFEHIMLGGWYYTMALLGVALLVLSYYYISSYFHRKTIPMINFISIIGITFFAILNTYDVYILLKTGLKISNTEYATPMYMTLVISTTLLMVCGLITFNKIIPHHNSKLPAYFRYVSIQNIRTKKTNNFIKNIKG